MASDHARIHLDIWGDDDWLDLPVDAQMLYFTLYTSPGRTLCGAHEWNPGKLAQRAGDWTVARIEDAGSILSRELFLIIDTDTGECLIRSWIKHDGLWRTPNMAVSVANARANLASRTLRGVIVFEVSKLKAAEPTSTSWGRDAVKSMLRQKAIDPAELEPFKGVSNPTAKGGSNGGANPSVNGGVNETPTHGVNGALNGGPTNAIPIANATERTNHRSDEPSPNRLPARQTGSEKARTKFASIANCPSVTARQVAHAYNRSLPVPLEAKVLSQVASQIDSCLQSEIPPEAIAAGIDLWTQSDSWAPSQIPMFVAKANRGRNGNHVGKPTQKAMDYGDAAEQLIAALEGES